VGEGRGDGGQLGPSGRRRVDRDCGGGAPGLEAGGERAVRQDAWRRQDAGGVKRYARAREGVARGERVSPVESRTMASRQGDAVCPPGGQIDIVLLMLARLYGKDEFTIKEEGAASLTPSQAGACG